MITIVNYGMGNLRSVLNAFTAIGEVAQVAEHPEQLDAAELIVLPGVGAFGDGMDNLRRGGWVDALERNVREREKSFLGICLGMQLLATTGTEHGRHEGLNWIAGACRRLAPENPALKVPHMGWNDVRFTRTDGLFAGLGEQQSFYFVHSYVLDPSDRSVTTGFTEHGTDFVSAIEWKNIRAVQFHPEKSQKAGLAVLRNAIVSLGRAVA